MPKLDWPFRAAEVLRDGALTPRELRRGYTAVYPGIWMPRGITPTPLQRARAAWLWSGTHGVLAGLSASALLGAKWIDPGTPAELIHTNRRPPQLLTVHSDTLLPAETRKLQGMPVTTAARTAFDLGRRLPIDDGVARIDALMNATDVKVAEVEAVLAGHPGARGLRRLEKTLRLVDGGAESPYESAVRLLVVRAGFPRPQTQVEVYDDYGHLIARIDLAWPEYLVGVDFEGKQHWTDPRVRDRDAERYARLPELGWHDIRLTARMFHRAPQEFLRRLGAALIARGCPQTWA